MSYELERIEALCRGRGWSHYRLAIEMDTSPNNIGNLFRRTTTPSIPTIRRICDVMGITMAQFYSADGVTVTLSERQKRILDLCDYLDRDGKLKAEAYMEGLSVQKARGTKEMEALDEKGTGAAAEEFLLSEEEDSK